MNILIIASKISNGGAERVAVDLYNQFKENHNVNMIVFEKPTKNSYKVNGNVMLVKNKFKLIPLKLLNPLYRIVHVYFLKKKLDITHSISFSDTSNTTNLFSKSNDKVISTIHTYRSKRNIDHGFRKFLTRFTLQYSDLIVTPSTGVKEDLMKNLGISNDICVIPNPLSVNILKYNKEKAKQPITIVSMGRLILEKRHHILIKVVSKMKKMDYDIHLKILGEGPERESVIELIKEEKLENNVDVLGFVEEPQNILKKSDFFVLASSVEGFGNVIIESLASGVPVISTDIDSGPREILAPSSSINLRTSDIDFAEYGILIPDNKIENLIENDIIIAIEGLLKNPNLYENYSKLGLNRAKEFSPENIKKMWEDTI